MVEIIPATYQHALDLGPRLRAEDAAEVLASGGFTPQEALAASVHASDVACSLVFDGRVEAIWGAAPSGRDGTGIVWLLGSPELKRRRLSFVRLCKPAIAALLEHYEVLCNAVDARYESALRWVQWLGFTVEAAQPFGEAGLPFCYIEIARRDVVARRHEGRVAPSVNL